jgi:AcrR family transcriptional regulator
MQDGSRHDEPRLGAGLRHPRLLSVEKNMTTGKHLDRRSVAGPTVTRADVRDAALTLFALRGFHGTSLKQVAQAVELRTPSLYNHIDSKADLLQDIVLTTLVEVNDEFEQALAFDEDPRGQLERATHIYVLHHAVHRREALVVNQDTQHLPEPFLSEAQALRRRHERRFRQVIAEGVDAGQFEVPSAKLASFAVREMCVSVARWFDAAGPLSATDVADTYTLHALRLVGAR